VQYLFYLLFGLSLGSVSGLGLIFLARSFRRSHPVRWKCLASRPSSLKIYGTFSLISTAALFWFAPGRRMALLFAFLIALSGNLLFNALLLWVSPEKPTRVEPEL